MKPRPTPALKEDSTLTSWGSRKSEVFWLPDEVKSGVVAIDYGYEYNRGVLSVAAGSTYSLILLEAIG